MILQALHAYYHRKAADPDPAQRLPAFGRELKEIAFILELTTDGRLAGVTDTRSFVGKKKVGARYLVPAGVKKTSGIAANLLWDNAEYVLGVPDAKKLADAQAKGKGKANDYLRRLRDMQAAFRARIEALPAAVCDDDGVYAVLAFLDADPAEAVARHAAAAEIAAINPVLSFRLLDEPTLDLVCQRPALAAVGTGEMQNDTDATTAEGAPQGTAMCLLTGEHAPPARLHTAIKGVWGAQTSGANIVSFNLDAFNSYGKTQGANAPISEAAAFAYTTALNHLLERDSPRRTQVGGASTVFWAQKREDTDIEKAFGSMLSDDVKQRFAALSADKPDANTDQIRSLYESIHHTDRFDDGRGQNRFYVLGLSPNAARIAVRFWHATTVETIAERIRDWFHDLDIDRAPHERPHPALRQVLATTCLATKDRPGGDIDRLPATLEGDVLRAIFEGGELPALLLGGALERCRADASRRDDRTGRPVRHVNAVRAGLLKAGVNRSLLAHPSASRKEIRVSLDKTNTDAPYLLGRLFAVFERVQEVAAERELNRTLRDAYFGAAMATPRSVFPRLLQLNQIHLRDVRRSRLSAGRYFDALLGEINDKFDAKKAYGVAVAGLRDQGIFTIGYYHQRQDFYRRSADKPADVSPAEDAGSDDAAPANAETLSDTTA